MELTISESQLLHLSKEILIASGADQQEAKIVSQVLVWCDLIGRENQGVSRLPILTQRIEKGVIRTPCDYKVNKTNKANKDNSSTVLIDGRQGMGHYLAHQGMEQAIKVAKDTGIAFVGVHDSNFFGAGAYYVQQAAAAGMIGIAASNSFPKVAAFQGINSVLGTNPFAFSAPRENAHHLLLDMATSASAGSTIRECIRKNEELPSGIAVDSKGNSIKNPRDVETGTILPFGGAKGYGLSLMVEILSGILTGAGFSHGVKSMYKNLEESGNNGHFFIAIDIKQLIPLDIYYQRMEVFISLLRDSGVDNSDSDILPSSDNHSSSNSKVLFPGELRWETYKKNKKHGLSINPDTTATLKKLASNYGIDLSQITAPDISN